MAGNLVPGQWQLGNIIIGTGTNIKMEDTDVKPYDINAQDYQVARSDETRFGFDFFKPTTIELTFNVLSNYLLPEFEGSIPNFWHGMPTINDVAAEWRGDDVRNIWGQLKPLYTCSKLDEIQKVVFGRPGQFNFTANDFWDRGLAVKCVAEFRRADTLVYSAEENSVPVGSGIGVTRLAGDGPDAWMQVIITGPTTNPTIAVGSKSLTINHSVPSGHFLTVSSYPWERYAVDSTGVNLAANITGANKYLDQLRIPHGVETEVTVSGGGSAALIWRDTYSAL